MSCPDCESKRITTKTIDHRFPYGRENLVLSARIPLRKCKECGTEFFDDEAENLIQKAVCHHLATGDKS